MKKTPSLDPVLYLQLRCLALDEGLGVNDLLDEAMEAVLKSSRRRQPPKWTRAPAKVRHRREKFSTTLDPDLYLELRKLAVMQRVCANDLLDDGMRRVLRRRKGSIS